MAISLVGKSPVVNGNNTSLTPVIPAGSDVGQLMLLFATIRENGATVDTPSGWTPMVSSAAPSAETSSAIFYKYHNGLETNPTVSFTGGGSNDTTQAFIITLSGANRSLASGVSYSTRTAAAAAPSETWNIFFRTTDSIPLIGGAFVLQYWSCPNDSTSQSAVFTTGTTVWTDTVLDSVITGADQSVATIFGVVSSTADVQLTCQNAGSGGGGVSLGLIIYPHIPAYNGKGGIEAVAGKVTRTWGPVQTFGANAGDLSAAKSIAITPTTLHVGISGKDTNGTDAGGTTYYNMVSGVPSLQGSITSAPASFDYFGGSVAVSGDGLVLAVTKYYRTGTFAGQGQVVIFDKNNLDWTWRETLTLSDPVADAMFGRDVALSYDGSIMAVSMRNWSGDTTERGSISIYDYVGPAWVHRFRFLESSPATGNIFGDCLAMSNDGSVIAAYTKAGGTASKVLLFDISVSTATQRTQEVTHPEPISDTSYGYAIAISGDASVLAVGSRSYAGQPLSSQGKIYLFVDVGGTYRLTESVVDTPTYTNAQFGYGLGLSDDGLWLAVGKQNSAEWSAASNAGGFSVYSLAASLLPNYEFVPNSGTTYSFTASGGAKGGGSASTEFVASAGFSFTASGGTVCSGVAATSYAETTFITFSFAGSGGCISDPSANAYSLAPTTSDYGPVREAVGTLGIKTGTGTLSVTVPSSGVSSGMLLVLDVGSRGSNTLQTTPETPSGWNLVESATYSNVNGCHTTAIYWRICDNNDAGSSVSITFANDYASAVKGGCVVVYSNIDGANPIESSSPSGHAPNISATRRYGETETGSYYSLLHSASTVNTASYSFTICASATSAGWTQIYNTQSTPIWFNAADRAINAAFIADDSAYIDCATLWGAGDAQVVIAINGLYPALVYEYSPINGGQLCGGIATCLFAPGGNSIFNYTASGGAVFGGAGWSHGYHNAPIALIDSGTTASNYLTGDLSVLIPAATQRGDLLILQVNTSGQDGNGCIPSTPSGWTERVQVGPKRHIGAFTKIAEVGDAGTYAVVSFTADDGTSSRDGRISVYRPPNIYIDPVVEAVGYATPANTSTIKLVTQGPTLTGNSMIVAMFNEYRDNAPTCTEPAADGWSLTHFTTAPSTHTGLLSWHKILTSVIDGTNPYIECAGQPSSLWTSVHLTITGYTTEPLSVHQFFPDGSGILLSPQAQAYAYQTSTFTTDGGAVVGGSGVNTVIRAPADPSSILNVIITCGGVPYPAYSVTIRGTGTTVEADVMLAGNCAVAPGQSLLVEVVETRNGAVISTLSAHSLTVSSVTRSFKNTSVTATGAPAVDVSNFEPETILVSGSGMLRTPVDFRVRPGNYINGAAIKTVTTTLGVHSPWFTEVRF